MKKLKEYGITILIDASVIWLAEIIMNFLKIENMWIQIGGIVISLLIADAVRKYVSDKKGEKFPINQ